jgi:hypothetical protein
MPAPNDYSVKINLKDGALEIAGPDKGWVDSKIDQLRNTVLAGFQPEVADREVPRQPKRKPARKKVATTPGPGETRSTPKRPRGPSGRSAVNEELQSKMTAEIRSEFRDYIDARRQAWESSQSAQAVIIATFLHDKLSIAGVDQHDLYTAYTVMGERSPANIRSQLTNARQRARYFSGFQDGKMMLSHAGENFARFDSVTGDDDGES